MRTTITIPDEMFEELMRFTKEVNRTRAVQAAVAAYVRRAKLERLRALRGKLEVVATEALDRADIDERRELFLTVTPIADYSGIP